jgi:lipid II:glycine glycyltransferase (peptidoglycan interpeptide bridge formation enzyme)
MLIDSVRQQHERDGLDVEIRACVEGLGRPGSSFYHHEVPLGPDVETVRRGFSASVRRRVAKAERDGVEVVRGTGQEALDAFYRLHLLTRKRQGVPTQPKRFIRRFANLFERDLGFVLEARSEGETIAAAVFLGFNGVLTYKYGASSAAHLKRKPNNALFMEAMRWGCSNGYQTFDLGRTDIDNEGLRSFKRGWGATERILTYTKLSRRYQEPAHHGVPSFARSLITRTPPITGRLVGEALYKHFG